MTERIRVSAERLRELWFGANAIGMIHDHSTEEVVVRMNDGTEYACTFAEKAVESGGAAGTSEGGDG